MDERQQETEYRYHPSGEKHKAPRSLEEEREFYYTMLRVKLSPPTLRRISWVNIAVLLGVLLAFFLGSLLMEKPKTSAVEKRDLAKFPVFSAEALFAGSYTREIETWFSDTFPFREAFVSLSAVLDEGKGIRVDDVRIVAPSGGEAQDIPPGVQPAPPPASQPSAVGAESSQAAESSQPEAPPAPVQELQDETVGPINNGIFVYKGRAMSLFGGNPQSGTWYAQVLNTYHEELPGVQIYNMIIPTAIEFYVPNKYRDLTQSQKAMIDHVYSNLDPEIKRVDAYSQLKKHTDEYIYFRTDHHWTGLGAYYAYQAFCAQAGLTPLKLEEFETRRLTDFIGTMYSQSQDTTLLQNPDYVDYYLFKQPYTALMYPTNSPYTGTNWSLWGEYAQSPNSYSVFLQGDFPLIEVKTGIPNGRKIMVVKESFGNAFVPFLINHYEEVYVVDQRYFQLAAVEFIKAHGINELLFANNSFAVCTPYHIRCIDNLRHQLYQPVVAKPQAPEAKAESSEDSSSEASSAASSEEEDQPDYQKESDEDRPRKKIYLKPLATPRDQEEEK